MSDKSPLCPLTSIVDDNVQQDLILKSMKEDRKILLDPVWTWGGGAKWPP